MTFSTHNDAFEQHALQPYWNMALASVQADALNLALKLDLFEFLIDCRPTAEVAQQYDWNSTKTTHFLDLLWSMQLLERHHAPSDTQVWHYRSSLVAKRYFVSDNNSYCGDAWQFRLHSLRQFGAQMPALLLDARPATEAPAESGWQAAARLQIAQEQRAATAEVALKAMQSLVEFERAERFLDLGGGPGWVAIALAQSSPTLTGVVYDLPMAASVAQENIELEGLNKQLKAWGGDLTRDDFGGGYDLIWCSSVLHFVPEIAQTLNKIKTALRPGGILVCAHAELPDNSSDAGKILPYYMPLLLRDRPVTKAGELEQALRATGFCQVEHKGQVPLPMAPVTLLIARKGDH